VLKADRFLSIVIVLICYISLSALYTVGTKQGIYVLALPSCCAPLVSRAMSPKSKSLPDGPSPERGERHLKLVTVKNT